MKVIEDIESLDPELTIYIKLGEWRTESEVVLAYEPVDGDIPDEAKRVGFEYFLEVSIAQEAVDVWKEWRGREPTLDQKCEAVLYYALNDAYIED